MNYALKTIILLSTFLLLPMTNKAFSQSDSTQIKLNIFPNPNNGTFYITVVDDASYQSELHAMDGRLVKTLYLESGLNYISIDIPAGLYILKVGEGERSQNFKIEVK